MASLKAPLGRLQAASGRLRRNYLWLFLAVYLGWLVKLSLGTSTIMAGAAVGPLPGPIVFGISILILASLAVVAAIYRLPEEE